MVDVGNEEDPPRPPMALNGEHRDSTGAASGADRRDRPPSNLSSSSRSTPSLKPKDGANANDKPGTPVSKPATPNGQPGGGVNGKPPTPGMGPFPPGFHPRHPGDMPPVGYPFQNGAPPPGLAGAFPPRPPLVSSRSGVTLQLAWLF